MHKGPIRHQWALTIRASLFRAVGGSPKHISGHKPVSSCWGMASQSLREHACWEEAGDGKQKEEKQRWRVGVGAWAVDGFMCKGRLTVLYVHLFLTVCQEEWAVAPESGAGDYLCPPQSLGRFCSKREPWLVTTCSFVKRKNWGSSVSGCACGVVTIFPPLEFLCLTYKLKGSLRVTLGIPLLYLAVEMTPRLFNS